MMQAITQNGVTYFPSANGTWLGTDGKKYVSRGPKINRQFIELNAGASYIAPDAGDANNGGGGFATRGGSPAPNGSEVPASGTDLSPKPVNIPSFVRNPFASMDLDGTDASSGLIQDPELGQINAYGKRAANIGGKMYEIDEEALADYEGSDPNMAVNPEFAEKVGESKGTKTNWMKDQRSDNEMARRRAFLDAPMGTGPRKLIEKRNAAMGIYNGQLRTNDGMVDLSSDQEKDYVNRGQEFLDDVMSGKITLGQASEPATTYPVQDVDASDVTSTIPADIGPVAIKDLRIPDDQMPNGPLGDVYPQLQGLGAETAYDPTSNTWRIIATTDKQGNVVNY